jgi:hypothetical protein
MKKILVNFGITCFCMMFASQSVQASVAATSAQSTTSLAQSLLTAERAAISDEELFGSKLPYVTNVSEKEAKAAVGEALPAVIWGIGAIVGGIASCVKIKRTERVEMVCENIGDSEQQTCRAVVVVETTHEWDCPG